jgi:hypothetical protein
MNVRAAAAVRADMASEVAGMTNGALARPVAVVAALCGWAVGCGGRPLLYPAAVADSGPRALDAGDDGSVVDVDVDAGADVAPAWCQPLDPAVELSFCGVIAGKPLQYTAASTFLGVGVSTVDVEGAGPSSLLVDIWGPGSWHGDYTPHPVSGWLVRPPEGWAAAGSWLCGRSGAIAHSADDAIDATLNEPAILPACDGQGGPASAHVELMEAPLVPNDEDGGRCELGFLTGGARLLLRGVVCPQVNAPTSLDRLRVISLTTSGQTTACIGPGATITLLPDSSATVSHIVIDIPSMSAPETCGPTVDGQLLLHSAGFLHPG